MRRVFVDANVFLRYFTRDVAEQAERAEKLFRAGADGSIALVTGPPVLFEVAWVMRRSYSTPRERVLDVLAAILSLRGLAVLDRTLVAQAVHLARQHGMDFADAYIAASTQAARCDALATFNRKHFERGGIALLEF
ncbi:type II toxin-antitoxin system VapC family toxin [bacterium]|nr:type II toxin-antitoxin system VapC family toxin [bacterium]